MTKSVALSSVSLPDEGVRAYERSPFVPPNVARRVPSPKAEPALIPTWSTKESSPRLSAIPPSSVIPVV